MQQIHPHWTNFHWPATTYPTLGRQHSGSGSPYTTIAIKVFHGTWRESMQEDPCYVLMKNSYGVLLQETLVQDDYNLRLNGCKTCHFLYTSRNTWLSTLVINCIPSTSISWTAYCGEGSEVQEVTLTLPNHTLIIYNICKKTGGQTGVSELFMLVGSLDIFIGENVSVHHPI